MNLYKLIAWSPGMFVCMEFPRVPCTDILVGYLILFKHQCAITVNLRITYNVLFTMDRVTSRKLISRYSLHCLIYPACLEATNFMEIGLCRCDDCCSLREAIRKGFVWRPDEEDFDDFAERIEIYIVREKEFAKERRETRLKLLENLWDQNIEVFNNGYVKQDFETLVETKITEENDKEWAYGESREEFIRLGTIERSSLFLTGEPVHRINLEDKDDLIAQSNEAQWRVVNEIGEEVEPQEALFNQNVIFMNGDKPYRANELPNGERVLENCLGPINTLDHWIVSEYYDRVSKRVMKKNREGVIVSILKWYDIMPISVQCAQELVNELNQIPSDDWTPLMWDSAPWCGKGDDPKIQENVTYMWANMFLGFPHKFRQLEAIKSINIYLEELEFEDLLAQSNEAQYPRESRADKRLREEREQMISLNEKLDKTKKYNGNNLPFYDFGDEEEYFTLSIYQRNRLRDLFPHVCKGEYSLSVMFDAFVNVTSLFFHQGWFLSLIKGPNMRKRVKLFAAVVFQGRTLPKIFNGGIGPIRKREGDAIVYWLNNLSFCINIFGGKRYKKSSLMLVADEFRKNFNYWQEVCLVAKKVEKVTVKRDPGKFKGLNEDDKPIPKKKIKKKKNVVVAQMLSALFSEKKMEDNSHNSGKKFGEGLIEGMSSSFRKVIIGILSDFPSKLLDMSFDLVDMMNSSVLMYTIEYLKDAYSNIRGKVASLWISLTGEMEKSKLIDIITWFLVILIAVLIWKSLKLAFNLAKFAFLKLVEIHFGGSVIREVGLAFDGLNENSVEAQSFTAVSTCFVAMGTILCSFMAPKAIPLVNSSVNIVGRTPFLAESFSDWITNLIDQIYFYCSDGEHLFPSIEATKKFQEDLDELNEFMHMPDLRYHVMHDSAVTKKLERIVRRGWQIKEVMSAVKGPTFTAYTKMFDQLLLLHSEALALSDMYKGRIETPMLLLRGKSGEGKSKILKLMPEAVYRDLNATYGEEEYPEYSPQMMFERPKGSPFWEGYWGQWGTTINELFSAKDPSECAREGLEILNMCEENVFPLNMAFGDKGKAFFRSELLVLTTNYSFDKASLDKIGMNNPDALLRRMTFPLTVVRTGTLGKEYDNLNESWKLLLSWPDEYEEEFFMGLSRFLECSPEKSFIHKGEKIVVEPEGRLHQMFKKKRRIAFTFLDIKTALAREIQFRKNTPKDSIEFGKYYKPLDLNTMSLSTKKNCSYCTNPTINCVCNNIFQLVKSGCEKDCSDGCSNCMCPFHNLVSCKCPNSPYAGYQYRYNKGERATESLTSQMWLFRPLGDMFSKKPEVLKNEAEEIYKRIYPYVKGDTACDFTLPNHSGLGTVCRSHFAFWFDTEIKAQQHYNPIDVACLARTKETFDFRLRDSAVVFQMEKDLDMSLPMLIDRWLCGSTYEGLRTLLRGLAKTAQIRIPHKVNGIMKFPELEGSRMRYFLGHWQNFVKFPIDALNQVRMNKRINEFEAFDDNGKMGYYKASKLAFKISLFFDAVFGYETPYDKNLEKRMLKPLEDFLPVNDFNPRVDCDADKMIQYYFQKIIHSGKTMEFEESYFSKSFATLKSAFFATPVGWYLTVGVVVIGAIGVGLGTFFAVEKEKEEAKNQGPSFSGPPIQEQSITHKSLPVAPGIAPVVQRQSIVHKKLPEAPGIAPTIHRQNDDVQAQNFNFVGVAQIEQRNARIHSVAFATHVFDFHFVGGKTASSYAFALGGTTFVMTSHFFRFNDQPIAKVCVWGIDAKTSVAIGGSFIKTVLLDDPETYIGPLQDQHFSSGRRDLALVFIDGRQLPPRPSLYNYLPSEGHICPKTNVIRVKPTVTKNLISTLVPSGHYYQTVHNGELKKSRNVASTKKIFFSNYVQAYGAAGQAGDCALAYINVSDSSSVEGKTWIEGFHVASASADGFFCPLYQEDLEKTWDFVQSKWVNRKHSVDAQCFEFPNDIYLPAEFDRYLPEPGKDLLYSGVPGAMYFGHSSYKGFMPSETAFKASVFQGIQDLEDPIFPITSAPAQLKPFKNAYEEWVLPLEKAKLKLGAVDKSNPIDDWIIYWQEHDPAFFPEGFAPNIDPLKYDHVTFAKPNLTFFTIEEVIKGIEGVLDSIFLTTSEGYTLRKKGLKRKDVVNLDTGHIALWIYEEIARLKQAVKDGKLPKLITIACLKDELRDLLRVLEGKTRMFHVGDFVHMVWMRMVLGPIVTWLKAHKFETNGFIGTNVHGFDWSIIEKLMHQLMDPKFGGGDYSGYDTGLRYYFGYMLGKFCVQFYAYEEGSDEYKEIIYACMSATAPLMLIGSIWYWFDFMNPSGGWATGFINTFVNVVIFKIVWMYLQKECKDECVHSRPECTFMSASFAKELAKGFYGDDNIWAVEGKYDFHWNMPNLARVIKEKFGMEYTRPDKRSVDEKFIPFSEIDFLKRRFVSDGSVCKARLDKESIHGMLLWIRNTGTESGNMEQLAINIDVAGMEYSYYEDSEFDEFKKKIDYYCARYNVPNTLKPLQFYRVRHAKGYGC